MESTLRKISILCYEGARSFFGVVADFTRWWVETAPSSAGEVLYQLRLKEYIRKEKTCQVDDEGASRKGLSPEERK